MKRFVPLALIGAFLVGLLALPTSAASPTYYGILAVQNGSNTGSVVTVGSGTAKCDSVLNNFVAFVTSGGTTEFNIDTSGDLGVCQDVDVARDVNVTRNLNVTGNTLLTGTLGVTGVTSLGTINANGVTAPIYAINELATNSQITQNNATECGVNASALELVYSAAAVLAVNSAGSLGSCEGLFATTTVNAGTAVTIQGNSSRLTNDTGASSQRCNLSGGTGASAFLVQDVANNIDTFGVNEPTGPTGAITYEFCANNSNPPEFVSSGTQIHSRVPITGAAAGTLLAPAPNPIAQCDGATLNISATGVQEFCGKITFTGVSCTLGEVCTAGVVPIAASFATANYICEITPTTAATASPAALYEAVTGTRSTSALVINIAPVVSTITSQNLSMDVDCKE